MRSAWNGAVEGLLAACRHLMDADVFDGAPLTADELPAAVFVGWQPNTQMDDAAGRIIQRAHDAGLPAARSENGDVKVTILAQSGDLELGPVRARAFELLHVLQQVLHHVPVASSDGTRPQQAAQLFLDRWYAVGGGQPLNVDVDSATVTQGHSPKGVWTQIDANVTYDALIN